MLAILAVALGPSISVGVQSWQGGEYRARLAYFQPVQGNIEIAGAVNLDNPAGDRQSLGAGIVCYLTEPREFRPHASVSANWTHGRDSTRIYTYGSAGILWRAGRDWGLDIVLSWESTTGKRGFAANMRGFL